MVQVYARQPDATVPVPAIRLVAFERVAVPQPAAAAAAAAPGQPPDGGDPVLVEMTVPPHTHTAVLNNSYSDVYNGNDYVVVERGRLELFVGGRQPTAQNEHEWLTVQVTATAKIASCKAL